MYDHAGRMFWLSALAVAVSVTFLGWHVHALMWSALGGAGLVLYPLLRRLVHKPRRYSGTMGNGLQFLGLITSYVGMMRAYGAIAAAHGGEDALTEAQWVFSLMQALGAALLAAAALLLIARWRWPDRYARQNMSENECRP